MLRLQMHPLFVLGSGIVVVMMMVLMVWLVRLAQVVGIVVIWPRIVVVRSVRHANSCSVRLDDVQIGGHRRDGTELDEFGADLGRKTER